MDVNQFWADQKIGDIIMTLCEGAVVGADGALRLLVY